MRVLVTGGAGFVGSHVAEALVREGCEVAVLDDLSTGRRQNLPRGVALYEGDVRDARFVELVFREVRPEAVSHQAAQASVARSVREPRLDADVNVLGLLVVLEAAARHGARRFVLASTGGALYGDVREPAGEDRPARPESPYGVDKWAGEEHLRLFARERGLSAVSLRYGNVYGPRQDPRGEAGVVAIFADALVRGRAPVIFGDGSQTRDYVYVEDVARANVLALRAPAPGPGGFRAYNVGTGVATDVRTLYARIRSAVGPEAAPEPTHGPPRPGDLRASVLDSRRIAEELGWRPTVDLDEGLRRTVAWVRAQAGRPEEG